MDEAVLVGLLFADRIIIENNGKKGIIGVFDKLISPRFPCSFPPWAIYAAVTNLEGKHEFALNLVCDETSQVIVPVSGQFEAVNRLAVIEIESTVMGAIFSKPGMYSLALIVDGQEIGTRVLTVALLEQTGG